MRRRLPDILILVLLFLLPLILFWPQTLGGRTLLPTENLYQFEPFATYREVVNAPDVPHNALLSDLVLENYQWKQFIRDSIAQREIPLWNPYQFSGIPFMAAGQQSTLYPFSVLYYVLPLTVAYGWFTVAQLWLAGAFMFMFLRGLNVGRFGATIAGVTYQLAAFFVISAVFPMIIAAAAWLPLLLLMIKFVIRQRPLFGRPTSAPWVAIGAAALGCNILAGHVEITYYTLLIMAYYAAARLFIAWRGVGAHGGAISKSTDNPENNSTTNHVVSPNPHPASPEFGGGGSRSETEGASRRVAMRYIIQRGLWLGGMVILGLALGAVQFIPLFEFASMNFRSGSASYEQITGWAHPMRDILQFALPNFYGNPSHHAYFDVFSRTMVPVTVNGLGQAINHTEWGIKNYAEGALYVGILPLVLAGYAVVNAIRRRGESLTRPQTITFLLLALLGLTLMFGLPTYRLLYLLPGIDQLHSPFRWIYAVTLSVAVLAGFGAHQLANRDTAPLRRWFSYGLLASGALILLGLLASYIFYDRVEPLAQWILDNMVTATGENAISRFADARMFYSYQFTNVLTLGMMLLLSGAVFWWANRNPSAHTWGASRPKLWQIVAVGLVAIDLMIASWGFNPASDPLLLDFVPPAIQWLQDQPGDWRYTTLDDPTEPPIMNANMGWQYSLRDIRGYESIIPKHYVDYMAQIAPQTQLDFNRVAPLYTDYGNDFDYVDALESPLLDNLGVRYVITHKSTTLPEELTAPRGPRTGPKWSLAYEDEAVRIWSNGNEGLTFAMADADGKSFATWQPDLQRDTGREKFIDVRIDEPTWLVVNETYMPGWRAFIRPWGMGEEAEQPLDVQIVEDALQGVHIDDVDSLINQAIANGTAPQTMYLNAIETAIAADDEERVNALIDDLDALVATNPPELFGNLNGRIAESIARWRQSSNTSLEQRAFETELLQLRQANWTVRMVYSPASFQIGLFVSFIGTVLVIFMLGVWLWRQFVASDDDNTVARVARNSLAPIILNLFNRGIDFAFAFIMLRILGPADAGIYFYAGFIFIWFDIFTNFGLDVFLTREVARDPSRAARYFFTTSALRLSLTLAGVVLLAAFLFARQTFIAPPLSAEGVIAIILLYIGLLPGSLSKGMTSLFYAFQQAEYPAAITTLSTINKVILGLMALVLGFGVIGLAAVSIVTNVLTLVILMWGGRRLLTSPLNLLSTNGEETSSPSLLAERGLGGEVKRRIDLSLIRHMTRESWPLMVNHFLATIFFQIDILIIEAMHGVRMVGLYSVAYKWVAALNIVPAFFTQAMLPVMSRQAHEDREALKRTYILAVKLLVSLALPVAVLFTFLAWSLTALLGGSQFLPDGAIATQLMIWSIPIGWVNSLTQYVLIALDLQRRIMRAFAIAVAFNIITNLVLIPQYGYQAAALTTIASEMMLLLPFGWLLHGALGAINWGSMVWRPAVAASGMFAVMAMEWDTQPVIALIAGAIIYPAVLLVLRPFSTAEINHLLPLLPGRLRSVPFARP